LRPNPAERPAVNEELLSWQLQPVTDSRQVAIREHLEVHLWLDLDRRGGQGKKGPSTTESQ
jgi:hypothetical protein